jgi:hypothetical protein
MLTNGGRVSISDCKYEINAATRAGGAVSITKGSLEMVASSVISNYAGEADGMHCPCMRARVHTLSHTCVCVCVCGVCVCGVCVCVVCVCVCCVCPCAASALTRLGLLQRAFVRCSPQLTHTHAHPHAWRAHRRSVCERGQSFLPGVQSRWQQRRTLCLRAARPDTDPAAGNLLLSKRLQRTVPVSDAPRYLLM